MIDQKIVKYFSERVYQILVATRQWPFGICLSYFDKDINIQNEIKILNNFFLQITARIFSSHYNSLKFTESNNDSNYSSAGRSLQHEVSEHTKQRGWLRLSALVESWSSCLAVPLSYNDH